MLNKNIKNKPKKRSGKNELDGFSRILDIQKFSEGGPPNPSLTNGIHGLNPHFTKLSPSLPADRGGGSGRWVVVGVQTLNFRELGSTVEKCILFGLWLVIGLF